MSLDIDQQVLAGASTEGVGEIEVQEPEVGSWITARRGRGKSTVEASPELVHPKKYASLRNVEGIEAQGWHCWRRCLPLTTRGMTAPVSRGARTQARLARYW